MNNFKDLHNKSIADGVISGILKFLNKNNVDLTPVNTKKIPLNGFTSHLLAEYKKNPSGYPFKDSFRTHIEAKSGEEFEVLKALFDNNEMDHFHSLCRIIGCSACLEFLEAHREEVLALILKIRGVK